MYREDILELYKHPNNFGICKNPTVQGTAKNPLCGDEITLSLVLDNNIIKEVKFQGKGCAISMASASLFTDMIKGKTIEEAKNMQKQLIQSLGMDLGIVRLRCAMLPIRGIENAKN